MPSAIDFVIESIRSANKTKNNNEDSSNVKYPCGICKNNVKNNDKAILCSTCSCWIHIRCNGISVDEYKLRMQRNKSNAELIDTEIWNCLNCVILERSSVSLWVFA